jgi:hypothetical protein
MAIMIRRAEAVGSAESLVKDSDGKRTPIPLVATPGVIASITMR